MIFKLPQEKGILANLLEKGIKILLKKECKRIDNIQINIIASSKAKAPPIDAPIIPILLFSEK